MSPLSIVLDSAPRPCKWCGTKFPPKSGLHLYCSRECRIAWHRDAVRQGMAAYLQQEGREFVPRGPYKKRRRARRT